MFFDQPAFPLNDKDPDFERLLEQSWYLKGCLLADPEYRLDDKFDPKLIDPYGNGTAAFWRGVIETPKAGAIRMDAAGGREYRHPTVELRGSYAFLCVFLDFLEEHLAPRVPGPLVSPLHAKFDDDGKLAFQAAGERIHVRGPKAQAIVRLLYWGQTVGRSTPAHVADTIFAWVSGKR